MMNIQNNASHYCDSNECLEPGKCVLSLCQKFIPLLILIIFLSEPFYVYSECRDSLNVCQASSLQEEHFKWQKLIAPVALVTAGSIGVNNGWLKHIRSDVKDGMNRMRGSCYFHADDYIQYLPAAAYLGVGFIPGNKGKHNFKERLCAGVTAYAAMALVTNVTKVLVREKRPDSNARNSFPSGHTATVFTGAELMRLEYGPWVGLGGYAVATGVAFLRLYDNRHWLNDVIAGAGIGILCANVGYWLLPLERKWFKIKQGKQILIAPSCGQGQSYGLSMTAFM